MSNAGPHLQPTLPQMHGVRRRPRFQMMRTIGALILREMATTYGRSVGGYFWAIIEPVLGIALLSVVFSLALRSPSLGTNFPLFYASGYLPFVMVMGTIGKVAKSVQFSRPFMAYPCVTFMDAILARLILAFLTNLVIFAIVVPGIMLIYDLPVWLDLGPVLMSIGLGMLLAAGIGTLNCFLMTSFPVYEQVWSIATRPLFLISGVFFTYDNLPSLAQEILWYNPLMHLVGMMRQGLYPTYQGEYVSIAYVSVLAMVTLFFGLLLLNRHFKKLMEG